MIAIEREFYAYLDQVDLITVLLPYSYFHGESKEFRLKGEGIDLPLEIQEKRNLEEMVKYSCRASIQPDIGKPYEIVTDHGGKTDLQIGAVIRTEEFDRCFFYEGMDLGVSYTPEKSTFKLWAPTAGKVRLKLLTDDQQHLEFVHMRRADKGVWSITVERDLELYRYSFLVCVNLEWREAVDPYATAATVNGEYGVVIDRAKASVAITSYPPMKSPVDAIIYEAHIRDLTMHPNSGTSKKGTYLGAAEMNTATPKGESTGLSYIQQLGVTHIEFLPFHDFEGIDERAPLRSYNWGYNPVHYNVPDGSYATDPEDPYNRITELKQLISAIHKMGMGVIMDVVFNHVYIREDSSFEKIVPGYFFRHDQNGLPSNGTGVGNDIASERLMGRKYIVDSVLYWLKEYQVDGFRFDLMGILDVETMTAVRKAVDDARPHVLIIGEGWDLNTPLPDDRKANIANQAKLPKIAQFNDWFRDSIKGSTFNIYDKGYALGNERYLEAAKQVLAGSIGMGKWKSLFLQPTQSVNYIESHDNHTLWDKLKIANPEEEEAILKRQHKLATSMVLLAQGIPFLHSGQEFFRTKKGVANSYGSPDDINWLDWDLRDHNLNHVSYIKGMIEIRTANEAFRMEDSEEVRRRMAFLPLQTPLIGFELQAETGWDKIVVLFNPSLDQQTAELPEQAKWMVLADHQNASAQPSRQLEGNNVLLEPCSLFIAAK